MVIAAKNAHGILFTSHEEKNSFLEPETVVGSPAEVAVTALPKKIIPNQRANNLCQPMPVIPLNS
jgi:hypothetical protein